MKLTIFVTFFLILLTFSVLTEVSGGKRKEFDLCSLSCAIICVCFV